MRPDQRKRLAELEEYFVDVLIDESSCLIDNITKDRGLTNKELRTERFMLKTHITATAKMVFNFQKLQENTRDALGRAPYLRDEMDKQIDKAERNADEVLSRVMERRPIKLKGAA